MSNRNQNQPMRLVLVMIFLLCVCGSANASAQSQPRPQGDAAHADELPTRDAASRFMNWFRSLMGSMPSWVASVDKEKLLDQLRDLNADLFWVRDRKSLLLAQMETGAITSYGAVSALDSINLRVRRMSTQVQKVGSKLNEQNRAGGDSVARRLSEASGARKLWVSDMEQAQRQRDTLRIRALLSDGRRTVAALDSAGAALGALIEKLGGS